MRRHPIADVSTWEAYAGEEQEKVGTGKQERASSSMEAKWWSLVNTILRVEAS